MATHNVKFTIPERALGKADITFQVRKDEEKLGELRVSNGSAVWFPRSAKQGFRTDWTQVDELFRAHWKQVEKR